MSDYPLISIITVVYNGASTLEQTTLSVINQTYKNIEYIIIDGGSTDGTIDIIKKYEDKLAYWISEPDEGIYNAMNKGIMKASGEWILFLNSSDSFYSNTVLDEIKIFFQSSSADVLYGDTICIFPNNIKKKIPASNIKTMKKKIPFCHQSCFIKTELAKDNLFDLKYKICGDYNQFFNLYENGSLFMYMPFTISNYNQSKCGISNSNERNMLIEMKQINKTNKKILFESKLFFTIKKRCPSFLIDIYRRLRY